MNFQETVNYLTTIQRDFIPFYDYPRHDNELPIDTHVRVNDTIGIENWRGKTGIVIGYEQPPTGWVGWHWILFDGDEMPPNFYQLPKIHHDYLDIIE